MIICHRKACVFAMSLAIIIHGGAGAIAPERHEKARAGCAIAAQNGWMGNGFAD
jgi:isoaspartyl peptidase/L-asparaginase-like protein (Ntn-hydrolase superfamily)